MCLYFNRISNMFVPVFTKYRHDRIAHVTRGVHEDMDFSLCMPPISPLTFYVVSYLVFHVALFRRIPRYQTHTVPFHCNLYV